MHAHTVPPFSGKESSEQQTNIVTRSTDIHIYTQTPRHEWKGARDRSIIGDLADNSRVSFKKGYIAGIYRDWFFISMPGLNTLREIRRAIIVPLLYAAPGGEFSRVHAGNGFRDIDLIR